MKNRWLIALSAVGIHICIGSVYAERAHQTDYGTDGFFPAGNDMDFFSGYFIFGAVRRIYGDIRGKIRPAHKRFYFDGIFRHRHVRYGAGAVSA